MPALYNNNLGANNSNFTGNTGYSLNTNNPYSQIQLPNSTINNGIVWVQGEAGAKAYPVAAGGSVLLMDSETEQFYIKSTDISGMPMPLRTFKYDEITNKISEKKEKADIDMSKYVTFEDLEKRLNKVKNKYSRRYEYDEDDLDE